jgi:hypothetical protein
MNDANAWRWMLTALIAGLMGASCLAMLFIGSRIRRFLAETPSLDGESDLERYKSAVAGCMYAVLVCLGTTFASIGVGLAALALEAIAEVDVLPAIVLGLLRFGLYSAQTVEWEDRMKTVPASRTDLLDARNEVVRIWDQSPIPTW